MTINFDTNMVHCPASPGWLPLPGGRNRWLFRAAFPAKTFVSARLFSLFCLFALPPCVPASASPVLSELLADNREVARIMKLKPIVVETTQQAPVPFADVIRLIQTKDALGRLQTAYAAHLPEGTKPEFTIRSLPEKPGYYFYTNQKGIRTDVRELVRRVTSEGTIEVVFLVDSDRFFGPFSAVIVIEGQESGPAASVCRAEVFALPERRTVRFFVRNLKLVERFFKGKTSEMQTIFTGVVVNACQALAAAEPPPATIDLAEGRKTSRTDI